MGFQNPRFNPQKGWCKMSKQHMETVGNSLADLKAKKAPKIDLVVVPTRFVTKGELQEGTTALQLAAENLRRKKVAQAADEAVLFRSVCEFAGWMTDIALRHIADINSFVDELGPEYLQEEYVGVRIGADQEEGQESDAEKKPFTVSDELRETRDKINYYLNCGDPRVVLPLEATEVAFWLSIKPFTRDELEAKMRKLVSENVLVLNRHGDISVFKETYSTHRKFDELKEPQRTSVKTQIKDAILAQVNRLREEMDQKAKAKAAQVKAKITEFIKDSDISVLEVLDKTKTGRCGALVSGGAIWFLVNINDIELLDVSGAPENGFANLVNIEGLYPGHKISVARKTLIREDGTLAKSSDAPRVEVPLEVSKNREDGEKWIASSKFAWHSVRSAIELAMDCERKRTQGLRPEEFHEGELGRYKPTTENFVFKFFDRKTREVAREVPLAGADLEVERFELPDTEDAMIRVTTYNPEFKNVLEEAGCLNPEGYLEGDRYDRCPLFIRLLLQSDFRERIARPKETQKENGHVEQNGKAQKAEPAEATDKTRVANVCADLTRFQ